MKIAMGCDHAAVEYKNEIRDLLRSQGHEVTDVGIEAGEKADYPDIAEKVEAEVRENLWKLNGGTPKAPAKAADKAVAVSADDFDDED